MAARVVMPAAALVLSLALTGCGEEKSGGSGDPAAPTAEDEVRALADDYVAAMREGDAATACGATTERFQREELTADGDEIGVRTCEDAVEFVSEWYDSDPEEWEEVFGGVRDVAVDGDEAVFVIGDEGDGSALHVVRRNGAWLIDSDESEYSYYASLTTPQDEARWESVVCDLEEGMTRDEVVELMGEPTIRDAADFYWHGPDDDGPEYFAFFDEDDILTEYGTGGRCRH